MPHVAKSVELTNSAALKSGKPLFLENERSNSGCSMRYVIDHENKLCAAVILPQYLYAGEQQVTAKTLNCGSWCVVCETTLIHSSFVCPWQNNTKRVRKDEFQGVLFFRLR